MMGLSNDAEAREKRDERVMSDDSPNAFSKCLFLIRGERREVGSFRR